MYYRDNPEVQEITEEQDAHPFVRVQDRPLLQELALVKIEIDRTLAEREEHLVRSSILAQAPHLAWRPFDN
jgi:hypothetical protein